MRSLVVLLSLALGYVALDALSKAAVRNPSTGRRPGSFPFPTAVSHQGINMFEAATEIPHWAQVLGCDEAQLRTAVDKVGTSVDRVREYLRLSQ